jgi:hypothetical protein
MLSGLNHRQSRMIMGKTVHAQGMESVPWKTFAQLIWAPPNTPKGTDRVHRAVYVPLAIVNSELELDATLYLSTYSVGFGLPKTWISYSF